MTLNHEQVLSLISTTARARLVYSYNRRLVSRRGSSRDPSEFTFEATFEAVENSGCLFAVLTHHVFEEDQLYPSSTVLQSPNDYDLEEIYREHPDGESLRAAQQGYREDQTRRMKAREEQARMRGELRHLRDLRHLPKKGGELLFQVACCLLDGNHEDPDTRRALELLVQVFQEGRTYQKVRDEVLEELFPSPPSQALQRLKW